MIGPLWRKILRMESLCLNLGTTVCPKKCQSFFCRIPDQKSPNKLGYLITQENNWVSLNFSVWGFGLGSGKKARSPRFYNKKPLVDPSSWKKTASKEVNYLSREAAISEGLIEAFEDESNATAFLCPRDGQSLSRTCSRIFFWAVKMNPSDVWVRGVTLSWNSEWKLQKVLKILKKSGFQLPC